MLTGLIIYLFFVIFICLALGFYVLKLKRGVRPFRAILATLVIITLPLIVLYSISNFFPMPETTVPNLVGLERDEAEAKVEGQNLIPQVFEEVYQGAVKENTVVSQRPEPGSIVKVGRNVTIVVSAGKRNIEVPNLVGRDFAQVQIVLKEAGLEIGEKYVEQNSTYEAGTVLNQTPIAGEKVIVGTPISVIVAIAPTQEGGAKE